jgi:4-hydroxy-3-polyprenylbenzoate decarboxylase
MFGAFHNCACVKIAKAYPLQGRRVMHSVWGAGQMAWTKTVFVVDADCDVHDTLEVLRRCAMHCDPLRDVERVRGPLDILDHAAPRLGAGQKLGFDCTRKIDGEQVGGHESFAARALPTRHEANEIEAKVRGVSGVAKAACPAELGHGWLFVSTAVRGVVATELLILNVLKACQVPAPAYIVLVAETVALEDIDRVLFHWVANSDASRDSFADESLRMLAFDATPKVPGEARHGEPVRAWPPILTMDKGIENRVRERWPELGLGEYPMRD